MQPGDLRQDSGDVNQAHRHPHQQAADLLVALRRQAPAVANRRQDSELIRRMLKGAADRDRCEGNNDAKDAAGHAGGEEVTDPE